MYVENGSSMSEKERRAGTVVVVAVSAALDIQPIFAVLFDMPSYTALATKIHIMCIMIALLCRITYDNKMTVRKRSATEKLQKVNEMEKVQKEEQQNEKELEVKRKWLKWKREKSDLCKNKMEWNEPSSTVCQSKDWLKRHHGHSYK